MNRRSALIRLGTAGVGVAAAATGVSVAATEEKHWLDAWSSQDIEACLRAIGSWESFRRETNKMRARRKKSELREKRADNEVLFRGEITQQFPAVATIDDRRVRTSSRREMVRLVTAEPCRWHGIDLPTGTIVLIDDRCLGPAAITRDGRLTYLGHMAEIIRAPHQTRVHIWRGSAAASATPAAPFGGQMADALARCGHPLMGAREVEL